MSRCIAAVSIGMLIIGCSKDSSTDPRSDTISPGVVRDLMVERTVDDTVTLRWTAPGDDGYAGQASHYGVRYDSLGLTEASWEDATPVPTVPAPSPSGATERVAIGGLARGRWYFALRTGDEEFNWSEISNVVTTGVGDTIAPARVDDLGVFAFDESTVSLTWTAPGDDGVEGRATTYDLRLATSPITDDLWDEATAISDAPMPSGPGTGEFFIVVGLKTGQRYYFALRTLDESNNQSGLSNVVDATTIRDTIPPARVTDLETTFVAGRSANLRWTAPGNNGTEGRAAEYDLRYALAPITESTWEQATRVIGTAEPAQAGTAETHTVTMLSLDTTYHFALRTADDVGNWADLSNGVTGTTASVVILTSSPGPSGVRPMDWEPNGSRIAFGTDWGERLQVHLVPAAGGDVVQLTMHPDGVNFPRWSPDGDKLACVVFRSVFPATYQGLGIMVPLPDAVPITISPHGENQSLSFPTWSPDGERIAYLMSVFPSLAGTILTVDASGGTPDTLFSDGSQISGLDWSPDGEQVVFSSNRSGTFDLWILSPSGGEPAQLTSDPTNESTPSWSPDGTKVAFSSDLTGNLDLWVMPGTGGPATQITFTPDDERLPTWAPSGDAIGFVVTRGGIRDAAIVYLP